MKVAIIDLGTNTFHLLIAETGDKEPQIIYKTNEPVKLGEDITKENLIIPAAFKRGIDCLIGFKAIIDQYAVDLVKAVATSGARSAKNGQQFVNTAKNETGIVIDIIDGNKEAEYIYRGVKWSGAISNGSLLMDIGGGSTEFILCDEEKLFWKKSYPIGAARLMQTFFKSDPISDIDKEAILQYLDHQLTELIAICKFHQPKTLIGSAGAFETFAGMINPGLNFQEISQEPIALNAYTQLSETLIKASHNEREKMDGLVPLRVDMIVMACLLTNYVIEKLAIQELKLSTYDLKMGVLAGG
ncbi:MAG: exopolyphosphatase [Bacteroidota bacterium]